MELHLLNVKTANGRLLHQALFTDAVSVEQAIKEDPAKRFLDSLTDDEFPLSAKHYALTDEYLETISDIEERPIYKFHPEIGKWTVEHVEKVDD